MPASDAALGVRLLADKLPGYTKLREYEKGEQPWMFASDKMLELFETMMRKYRLNVCRPVVRGVGRRLNIDDWDDRGAQEWWQNGGKRIQNRLWREMLRQGDAYTLTWPVGTMQGPVKTHRLRADEAIVVYSVEDPDEPRFAVKAWTVSDPGKPDDLDAKLLRVNVYWHERVERFVTVKAYEGRLGEIEARDLAPYDGDDAGEEIVYTGTLQKAGKDGLLPVQHFACQPDATPYGTSVLEDVLPVQDEINHIARTLITTTEGYALPLRVFTAYVSEMETHPVTNPETGELEYVTSDNMPDYHPLKDWFLTLPGENSKAFQLDAADLKQLLEVRRAAIQNATLTSGVPLGLLAEDSGNVPSGVALRVVESPLTDLVVDVQQDCDVPARNVARLHGFDAAPSWSSPITFDDTEKAEYALQLIETGLPAPKALEMVGLLDAEAFAAAVAEHASVERGVGSALMRAFRDGRDPAELVRE